MRNFIKRARHVAMGEQGASNVEIIVWISVVLVIATALFAFRGAIVSFISGAQTKVSGLNVA